MNGTGSLVVVNDEALIDAIESAKWRLVVVAPALSKRVATCLARRWHELGKDAVVVVVDTSADVFRLGYGAVESLALLEKTGQEVGGMLHRHDGIRVGVLIVDDTAVVYSPTPLLIEAGADAGPARPTKARPNGVNIGAPPPELLADLGYGAAGEVARVVGVDKATRAGIAAVTEELKQNPPQRFDISRLMIAFNTRFEYVEFSLKGAMLDRKTVRLPSDLLGIADEQTRRRLRTTFRLVSAEDKVNGEHLSADRARIARKFLCTIPQYGSIILRSDKEAFIAEVDDLRRGVAAFKKEVLDALRDAMKKHREELKQALLPSLITNPPERWTRSCLFKGDEASVGRFIDEELERAFGKAEDVVSGMEVHLVFKGVTYESLTDEMFLDRVRQVMPNLDDLIDIREVAPSMTEPEPTLKEVV
jgi:hypothetical protein